MANPGPLAFFGAQFDRQIAAGQYELNPFERVALPWMTGRVLDLGCGLGNLSLAAATQGAHVTALDACGNAVDDLAERALASGLDVWVRQADLCGWRPEETYDAVACTGLLMFFAREQALAGLEAVRDAVRPGGVAAVNVLVEGTTFTAMFDPAAYHLFAPAEVAAPFAGWEVLHDATADFPAPEGTVKRFHTLVVRRPAA